MPKVAVIHTVPSVYASFPNLIRETVPGVVVVNTVDEFLVTDTLEKGEFTTNNLNRLYHLLRCAEATDPDLILVSCSTLTPSVEKLRQLISKPILTIDGAMLKKAVATGTAITILATSRTSVEPTQKGLLAEAERTGKKIDIDIVVCDAAFVAINKMDKATHDKEVLADAAKIKNRDVIVLAQASTAHLEPEIQKATGIPTLSSPKLCMQELRKVLQ